MTKKTREDWRTEWMQLCVRGGPNPAWYWLTYGKEKGDKQLARAGRDYMKKLRRAGIKAGVYDKNGERRE